MKSAAHTDIHLSSLRSAWERTNDARRRITAERSNAHNDPRRARAAEHRYEGMQRARTFDIKSFELDLIFGFDWKPPGPL